MERQGYKAHTVQSAVHSLKSIARRVSLLDVEAVKAYLSAAPLTQSRKEVLADHLARFYRYRRIPFDKPHYTRVETLPFIPLESEVDQLISGMGRKTATFLKVLKETGMRPGEAMALRWRDIDFEKTTVNVSPEKSSKARQPKISNTLLAMLNRLPRKHAYIFRCQENDPIRSLDYQRRCFNRQRKRLAEMLQNPRIDAISFKTLRHFKATMEYHKTKDILHVMQLLGHKDIKNTLIYTHLVNFESGEFVCKTARTVDEARALVESGFDYVTELDDVKLFRKRK
jgi:integrase